MGRNSSSYPSLLFCQGILKEHLELYSSAGKAKANLDKLVAHLGINFETDQGSAVATNNGDFEGHSGAHNDPTMVTGPDPLPQGVPIQSPQLNWELSDIDIDAIAQSFRLESELHYLMHPSGLSGPR